MTQGECMSKDSAPQPRCGPEAATLLNCLVSKDADACSAALAAFKCGPSPERR